MIGHERRSIRPAHNTHVGSRPAIAAIRGERFSLLPMPLFIELKLASGMVAPHRGKDLVDVQELIRSAHLSREVSLALDPWVRERFLELWNLAQVTDPF
jgi:hypothetical protein